MFLRDYSLGGFHQSSLLAGFLNVTLGYISHLHSSSTPNLPFLPCRLAGRIGSQVIFSPSFPHAFLPPQETDFSGPSTPAALSVFFFFLK